MPGLLVDRADSGPIVVGSLRITPPIARGRAACSIEDVETVADSIKTTLARDPRLRTFLNP